MEELIVYLLKSGLVTAIFYGIYWFFLRNETFYKFNRHFLLAGIVCSVLLPFVKYTYQINIQLQPQLNRLPLAAENAADRSAHFPLWLIIVLVIYTMVTSFFLLRHLAGLIQIKKIVLRYGYTLLQGYKLINTPDFKSSFSVFNYIFIDISPETSEAERKLIIAHELAHVQQSHWRDLLLAQISCALQWFNPFAWLYLHAIKQNHEFLADEAVLQQGNSAAQYRAALINHSLKTRVFLFASSFANYDKFKRIKMMMKPGSSPVKKMAVLLTLPAFALFLFAFAEPRYHISPSVSQTNPVKIKLPEAMAQTAARNASTSASASASDKIQQPNTAAILKGNPVLRKKVKTTDQDLQKETGAPKTTTITITSASVSHPDSVEKQTLTVSSRDKRMMVINNTGPIQKETPLIIYNGKVIASINSIKPSEIESINVVKGDMAVEKYGDKGQNGVIEVHSKKETAKN